MSRRRARAYRSLLRPPQVFLALLRSGIANVVQASTPCFFFLVSVTVAARAAATLMRDPLRPRKDSCQYSERPHVSRCTETR